MVFTELIQTVKFFRFNRICLNVFFAKLGSKPHGRNKRECFFIFNLMMSRLRVLNILYNNMLQKVKF
jgi:hypothetical protein